MRRSRESCPCVARYIAPVALAVLSTLLYAAPQSSAPTPAFDAASIKRNTSGTRGFAVNAVSGGRWSVSNFTLKLILQVAFDVRDFQIVGGPAWVGSDGYDISAKSDSNAAFDQMRPMIQSLLADRFRLTVHRETRELPVYDLQVARSGLKLAATKDGNCVMRDPGSPPSPPRPGEGPACGSIRMGRGAVNGAGISMPFLATTLSGILGRVVTDKTGLTGTFDVHIEFAPDEAIADPIVGGRIEGLAPPSDLAAPSIFTALQEQLGLRLESVKGLVEVLVIDSVERPSEN